MSVIGDSCLSRNPKSVVMNAIGGWVGRARMFGGLAQLGGAKTYVLAEDDPVKDGNMGMIQGEGADMQKHPEGLLVGDHVALIGYGFKIL